MQNSGKISQNTDLVEVGWVKAAHSLRGEVFVRFGSGKPEWGFKKGIQMGLKERSGATSDREVLGLRPHKDGYIVLFDGVKDRTAAEALKGTKVFIPEEWLQSKPGENIYLKEILNFTLVDKTQGEVGPIVSFTNTGMQDLIVVQKNGQEYDVPYVDPLIVKIDFENRRVEMDLPLGLLGENLDGEDL